MVWAYVIENSFEINFQSNQEIFKLINEIDIADANCFFDMGGDTERPELKNLLKQIQSKDTLIIRSINDLADTTEDLLKTLSVLSKKKIDLCSLHEPYLSEISYLDQIQGLWGLYQDFQRKKKEVAYKKAVANGKVGRPKKVKGSLKELSLDLSVKQMQDLTGLSRSTIYRYKKNRK